MKFINNAPLLLTLAGALAMPGILPAADTETNQHAAHQAEAAAGAAPDVEQPMSERMQAMRARMKDMAQTEDPDQHMELMKAQMRDMKAMMADGRMMGKTGGMGMMDQGMQGGMMEPRMEMMNQCMEMMQTMMKQKMDGMAKPGE